MTILLKISANGYIYILYILQIIHMFTIHMKNIWCVYLKIQGSYTATCVGGVCCDSYSSNSSSKIGGPIVIS